MKKPRMVVTQDEELSAALERLIALSTERQPQVDWAVLEHVEELAWRE